MNEYTFVIGGVDSGVFASWIVDADTEEEAVERSKAAFEVSADADPIEVDDAAHAPGAFGFIMRVYPENISADNILEVYESKEA